MPFSGNKSQDGSTSLSPPSQRSVMPFNNVTTIQDVLDGRKTIGDLYPHTRGNWAPGEDTSKDYREKGDDYKRQERDEEILRHMFDRITTEYQKWKVKVPGGSKSFVSFELAQRYIRENNIPFRYLSRVAQRAKEESNRVSVISEAINGVFLVETIDSTRGVQETGSAFCVAPNFFITCAHVVQSYDKNAMANGTTDFGKGNIVKIVYNNRHYPARVEAFDLNLDLALLAAEIDVDPIRIDGDVQVGDDVIVIGSPLGFENNVSTGTIGGLGRQIYTYEGAPPYMFVDAEVFPGNSGGPVIKVDNGEIVGMITLIVGSEDVGGGLNAALPSSYIQSFCSQHIEGF